MMFILRRPDGNVHPNVAYAVLSEHKIGTSENIMQSVACLILEPDNVSLSEDSILASSSMENSLWMRNLFLTLLESICILTVVATASVAYHFCKK